jgi:hypothetical protein
VGGPKSWQKKEESQAYEQLIPKRKKLAREMASLASAEIRVVVQEDPHRRRSTRKSTEDRASEDS